MGIAESVRHTFIFVFFYFDARFTHGIGTGLELTIERIACTVGEEL